MIKKLNMSFCQNISDLICGFYGKGLFPIEHPINEVLKGLEILSLKTYISWIKRVHAILYFKIFEL